MKATGVRCGILMSAAPFFMFKQGNLNFVNVPIYLATGRAIKRVFDEYGK